MSALELEASDCGNTHNIRSDNESGGAAGPSKTTCAGTYRAGKKRRMRGKNGWAIDEPKGGKRKAQGDHVFT